MAEILLKEQVMSRLFLFVFALAICFAFSAFSEENKKTVDVDDTDIVDKKVDKEMVKRGEELKKRAADYADLVKREKWDRIEKEYVEASLRPQFRKNVDVHKDIQKQYPTKITEIKIVRIIMSDDGKSGTVEFSYKVQDLKGNIVRDVTRTSRWEYGNKWHIAPEEGESKDEPKK